MDAWANATKFLSEPNTAAALHSRVGLGRAVVGSGTCHRLSCNDLGPWRTMLLSYVMEKAVAVNVAWHPALHRALMLTRDVARSVSAKT